MSPEDSRHGTEAGHEQHVRDGEDPCAACHHAKIIAGRRRTKRKTMGYVYQRPLGPLFAVLRNLIDKGVTSREIEAATGLVESQVWRAINGGPETVVYTRTWHKIATIDLDKIVTPIGITRRIRALRWQGYSTDAIARRAGCHVDTVRDAQEDVRMFIASKVRDGIVAAYEEMSFEPPRPRGQQEKAGVTRSRNTALRRGWHSPMAWDRIDLDDEPGSGASEHVYQAAELVAEWDHLRKSGESIEQAARQLGVTVGAIEKAIERTSKGSAA
ncbi:hypothetical protein LRP67_16370 [Nocardioides sp. cx-169]|uniref:hypothetical protein n=1 Tax=Nocardioides sp. cx-169 TaxID=2899080 RepID=UPI001E58D327|nr:hypothetical protein [Nocardioides sp. cx-169]MCD4535669.1 hypothetical protein [Nocardioides sp. cx-169]